MDRHQQEGKHRRSIRLKDYDYSRNGAYFVTICAHNRECLFGRIVGEDMVLSEAGRMLESVWDDIPQRFPGVSLDAFIVMPNHTHGIILIDNPDAFANPTQIVGANLVFAQETQRTIVGANLVLAHETADQPPVGANLVFAQNPSTTAGEGRIQDSPLQMGELRNPGTTPPRPAGTLPGTLGRIVQAFKSLTTHEYTVGVKERGWPAFPGKVWQRNYYEHIIRSEKVLNAVREYVMYNALRWAVDPENPA